MSAFPHKGYGCMKQSEIVVVKCIGCSATRDIRAGEITVEDHPCCDHCGMPMIPVMGSARIPRRSAHA